MGALELHDVESALARLYAPLGPGDPTLRLRDEDRKKARELLSLVAEVGRIARRSRCVDAAAGHAYAGLVAAELVGGIDELVVIERDERRSGRSREAAERATRLARFFARAGDVGDASLWPDAPDLVLALHACGGAADAVIEAAAAARARRVLLVPCCYARALPFDARAEALADSLDLPRHALVRRPFAKSLVDAARVLRLEALGYDVELVAFVPASVTEHNLLFRCRRADEPTRMRRSAGALERLGAG